MERAAPMERLGSEREMRANEPVKSRPLYIHKSEADATAVAVSSDVASKTRGRERTVRVDFMRPPDDTRTVCRARRGLSRKRPVEWTR